MQKNKKTKRINPLPFLVFLSTYTPLSLFAQLTVDADSLQTTDIYTSVSLDEVVITSPEKNVNSRGLGNMQINMNQVLHSPLFLGERDVIKTMQFLPGVSAGMEGSSQLNIRGGTADQTLYLLDGAPIYNQNHAFGFFSMFNPDAVRAVNLYKGGIPTRYGDKLSGVVDVDLLNGDMKEHHGLFSLGLLAWTLAANGPILKNKLTYMVAARRSFPDLLYNGGAALIGAKDKDIVLPVFYDINGKLHWQMNSNSSLSWQVYTGFDEWRGMRDTDYEGVREKNRTGFGWRTTMTSLRYDGRLSNNRKLAGLIYYTNLNNFDYQRNKYKDVDGSQDVRLVHSSKLEEFGGKAWMEHTLNAKNKLTYGLETSLRDYMPSHTYRKSQGNTTQYDNGHLKLYTLSAYGHNETKYKGWLFDYGLRTSLYNNGNRTKLAIEPRLKATTFLNDKNKIMFAYDRMYQPVHTVNEMKYTIRNDFWVPFQESKMANTHQFSVGWKNYTTSNLSFSVEAYYKRMNNLLMVKNLENYLDFHQDFQTGRGSSIGAEVMVEYTKNRFTAWLSYSFSKSTRTFGSQTYPFKYDAPHDISAFFSYVVRKKGRRTNTLSTNIQYKSGYPYLISEISYPGAGVPGAGGSGSWYGNENVDYFGNRPNIRLRNFFRMDINYTMEKKMKRGSSILQLSLLNATGSRNPYAVYRKGDKYKALTLIPVLPSISYTRTF